MKKLIKKLLAPIIREVLIDEINKLGLIASAPKIRIY